eukprot:TRINITY_DN22041_c0_g2_i1.p1 TRINITY_DN22041_c0_g2~~TRINITY_DN22041_c0_g2_i1.p1  ORF type:complete len:765 (+),score=152.82 TRINITY_DN22041_c0_g2_i1:121-2415(+)
MVAPPSLVSHAFLPVSFVNANVGVPLQPAGAVGPGQKHGAAAVGGMTPGGLTPMTAATSRSGGYTPSSVTTTTVQRPPSQGAFLMQDGSKTVLAPGNAPPGVPAVPVQRRPLGSVSSVTTSVMVPSTAPAEEAQWHNVRALCLGEEGEAEEKFNGKAQLLDRNAVRGVSSAIEGLNSGRVQCSDDWCVVFSTTIRKFYMLHKRGKRKAAMTALGLKMESEETLAMLGIADESESAARERAKTAGALSDLKASTTVEHERRNSTASTTSTETARVRQFCNPHLHTPVVLQQPCPSPMTPSPEQMPRQQLQQPPQQSPQVQTQQAQQQQAPQQQQSLQHQQSLQQLQQPDDAAQPSQPQQQQPPQQPPPQQQQQQQKQSPLAPQGQWMRQTSDGVLRRYSVHSASTVGPFSAASKAEGSSSSSVSPCARFRSKSATQPRVSLEEEAASGERGNSHNWTVPASLKLIVFDFDQTLAVCHVFKTLAGLDKSSELASRLPAGPYALSEAGQLRLVEELDRSHFKAVGGFATLALGGHGRVNQIRAQLGLLRALRVNLLICTKGLVGVVRKILQDLRLLQYFEAVHGNIGAEYGQSDSIYDASNKPPDNHALLGELSQAQWGTKPLLISKLLETRMLNKDEVVLVEDDPEEIKGAKDTCRTIFVSEAKGMHLSHFEELQSMVRLGGNHNGPPGKQADAPLPFASRGLSVSVSAAGAATASEVRRTRSQSTYTLVPGLMSPSMSSRPLGQCAGFRNPSTPSFGFEAPRVLL